MKPFPEGFQLTIPVWVIGDRAQELDGEQRSNPVSEKMEDAVLVFTKLDLAKSAARSYVPDPEKPISGSPVLVERPLMAIAEPLALLGLIVLLQEEGKTHVRFNRSDEDAGYSIPIDVVRALLAEDIINNPLG